MRDQEPAAAKHDVKDWQAGMRRKWRAEYLEIREVPKIFNLLDNIVVQLKFDQLVKANQVVDFQYVHI